jgi:class 3 adenylate cyclase/predicted ATPase
MEGVHVTIARWLSRLGLGQYADAFESNDIDLDVLASLTEHDLERLGVSMGHRKRILKAINGEQTDLASAHRASGLEPAKSELHIESATAEGERRQVTVLFCDLVGSTGLSNALDPEVYRGLLSRYHETVIRAIQRFDGYVAQIQGDGVVAYFGYPLAHEGEADRALRAALEVLEALRVSSTVAAEPLQVRLGIASGLVVVSHILAPDKSAVGETPNLAHRLQALAQPGEVMVSERTRALAGGGFDYEDRGLHALKGIAGQTRAWRVRGVSSAASRFEAATRGWLTPMVGREQEVGLLLDRWTLSRTGEGQVVLLQGEPGIGKSRMLRAFRERVGPELELALQYQCSPYYTNSAFYPIVDHLERALGFTREDSAEDRLDKLERYLIGEFGRGRTECNLLGRALAIACEARYGALEMSPQRQKDDTIALLVDLVAELARRQAAVVLFEDVHWADPSSMEVLGALIDRTQSLPLLVLLTYRPEFEPAWLSRPHVSPIALTRLSRAQGASIVLRVANDKPLPGELVTQIVDKTDGVPLFLEELTKAVLESDMLIDAGDRYDYSGKVEKLAIPNTLRDSLMARLDRLIPVKEIAQIGAVLGREFSYELVAAVSPMSEGQLDEALDKLSASGLVFRRGNPPNAIYTFKHALVQDAAYDSLLRSKRQALHAQIARAIEQRFPDKVNSEPELLAHHYTEAGMYERAVPLWQMAGELAARRVAFKEAIRHYERGLGVVFELPPSATRDTCEVQLRTLLAMAWVALHGYTHTAVLANLEAALPLDRSRGEGHFTLRILWGLWVYRFCDGEIAVSLEWAQRLLARADELDDDSMRLTANWAACCSHLLLGNFARCVHHADVILSIYDTERDRHMADLIHHDPKSIALAFKAAALWRLGYPQGALANGRAAIENAAVRGHAFDHPWAHAFVGLWVFTEINDTESMATSMELCRRLALVQGLPFFSHVWYPLSRALWLLKSDRPAEAQAQFKEASALWLGAGFAVVAPMNKTSHAESALRCGDIAVAFSLLDEALAQIERPGWGERCGLSNLLRVKACALQASGKTKDAEEAFLEALRVAREQHARSLELRAATGYARLLRDEGRVEDARASLEPVYDWFTEGHDTRDLKEAAALLEELR